MTLPSELSTKMDQIMQKLITMEESAALRHAEVTERLENVEKDYEKLKKKYDAVQSHCKNMDGEISEVKTAVCNLQQHHIGNNVVIKGVPDLEDNTNDLQGVIQSIFSAVGCPELQEDIISMQRIGRHRTSPSTSKKSHRLILVRFKKNESKQQLLSMKKKKQISLASLHMNGTPIGTSKEFIFVDDHQTPHSSNLMFLARKLKKEGKLKYVWSKNGFVMVKKDENAAAKRIESEGDLLHFDQPINVNHKPGKRTRNRSKSSSVSSNADPEDSGDESCASQASKKKKNESSSATCVTRSKKKAVK